MARFIALFACILTLSSWLPALAQSSNPPNWHASVLAGGLRPDSARNGTSLAAGATLTGSRRITQNLDAELRAFVYNMGTRNVSNSDLQGMSLGVTWWGAHRGLSPYLYAAPALFRSPGRFGRSTDAGLNLALGITPIRFAKGVKLDAEVVTLIDFYHGQGHQRVFADVGLNLGLRFGLPLASPAPAPGSCPNNPACKDDSDHDGVPNSRDQCPFTPPGEKVNAEGCGMDKDMDGVPDYRDRCPNTPRGATVNRYGCAVKHPAGSNKSAAAQHASGKSPGLAGKTEPQHVDAAHFSGGSATLSQHARHVLVGVAKTLKSIGYKRITLIGHTANEGSAQTEHHLALQRARAVRRYLIQQGLAPASLTVKAAPPSHVPAKALPNVRHVEMLIYYAN